MPHGRCPVCGYEEPFQPSLNNPRAPITLEEWWRRFRAQYGADAGPDTVVELRCAEHTVSGS
jgi:hypothetical protein